MFKNKGDFDIGSCANSIFALYIVFTCIYVHISINLCTRFPFPKHKKRRGTLRFLLSTKHIWENCGVWLEGDKLNDIENMPLVYR